MRPLDGATKMVRGFWAWLDQTDPVLVWAWIEKHKEGSWRPGHWTRTIERGKRTGHYVVKVGKLTKEGEWVMVERVVHPDHVKLQQSKEEYDIFWCRLAPSSRSPRSTLTPSRDGGEP